MTKVKVQYQFKSITPWQKPTDKEIKYSLLVASPGMMYDCVVLHIMGYRVFQKWHAVVSLNML